MPPDCPAAARRRHSKPRHPAERNGKKSNKRASVIHDISPPETAASFVPLECSTHSAAGKKKKVVRCQVAALLLLPHCSLQDDSPFSSPQPLAGTSHVTLFDPSTYTETIFLSPRRRRRRRSCLLLPVLGKKDGPPISITQTHTLYALGYRSANVPALR